MDLYKEILIGVLQKQKVEVIFPGLELDAISIVESESYNALRQIKQIIDDDSLSDEECFAQIEEIVCVFEGRGSGTSRHDFG